MLRSTTLHLALLAVLALGTACDGSEEDPLEAAAPPPVPAGLNALIPTDAFAFVELESINALDLCARDLIAVFDSQKAEEYQVGLSLGADVRQRRGLRLHRSDPTRRVGVEPAQGESSSPC